MVSENRTSPDDWQQASLPLVREERSGVTIRR